MTHLRKYNNPKLFWKETSPYLKKEEAKNSLCLGLSYNFQIQPNDCLFQAALFDDQSLLGSLTCSQYRTDRTLITTPVSGVQAAKKLFDEFCASKIEITGIVGELKTVRIYEKLLHNFGKKTQLHMIQGIYRCKHVVLPSHSDEFNFRVATTSDVRTIGKWIEEFRHEAVPHDPPVNGLKLASIKIEGQMIYVIEDSSQIVSMAGLSRDIETSCSVNLVYTPPQYRKRGYGSIITAKLTQKLLADGKLETNLYTDMNNPTSNKIYQDIGYQFVADSLHLGISN